MRGYFDKSVDKDSALFAKWLKQYHVLKVSYTEGKRWLRIVEEFSWEGLLLIPFLGGSYITNRKVHRLSNELFNSMLTLLVERKKDWTCKVASSIRPVISVQRLEIRLGDFNLPLESIQDIEIEGCMEYSGNLATPLTPIE